MAEGVDCVSLLESGEDTTGHALIQVCGNSGENSILLFPGANFKNTRQEMIHAVNRMEPGDILLMQNEINDPEFLLQLAAEKKLKIFWNPAPMNDRVENCPLELVDCLIVNEVEAAQLAHTAFCPDDPESLKRIADCLRQKVCHAEIVITLGAAGSVYWPADRLQKPCFVQACPGPVVDTTAAGDTYLGYLIAEIAAGKDFTEAMHTASKAAALAVGHAGAIPSIPCRTALQ